MFKLILEKYNNQNWQYIDFTDKIILSRYTWINSIYPKRSNNYGFSHEHDIIRFFLMTRTFKNKQNFIDWNRQNTNVILNEDHNFLLESWCFSIDYEEKDLDTEIDNNGLKVLLFFILNVLERAFLWYDPEGSYPSDFMIFLMQADCVLKQVDLNKLKKTETTKIQGMCIFSSERHSKTYHQYFNLICELYNGEISYNLDQIRCLAKQAHETLLLSTETFFDYTYSSLDEFCWELKIEQIKKEETKWCSKHIQKLENKNQLLLKKGLIE